MENNVRKSKWKEDMRREHKRHVYNLNQARECGRKILLVLVYRI